MNGVRQIGIVFKKYLVLSLRNPYVVAAGIVQPLLYLYLFGPLLTSLAQLNPRPNLTSYDIFVPGLLLQLVLFGAAFVGLSTITEWRSGELERVLTTPASRFSLLGGRVARDVVIVVVEGVLLVLAAFTLGLRQPIDHLLLTLLVVAVLTIAVSSMSYLFALVTKSEEALTGILNGILLPIVLLSGIILPMSLAPKWLFVVSRFNPLAYVLDGMRVVFADDGTSWRVWLSLAVSVALAVLLFFLAHRKMNSDNQ